LYPQITQKGQMILVGLSILGDSRTDIPDVWDRFQLIEPRIHQAGNSGRYVIITWGIETELSSNHFLFTGVQVRELEAPPLSSVIKILPAAQYAVFSCWASELDTTWRYALEGWLPGSPYQMPGFIIRHYDRKRFFGNPQARREVDILIPLRKKRLR
jgi:predicted transcriptional regulator YdeE